MARLFLQVILLVALIAVLDCAPASPPLTAPPPAPPKAQEHGGSATGKPRHARAAQQPNAALVPNPLQTASAARTNQQPTTVRARPARASDQESKLSDQPNPVLYGTQLDGNERSQEDHSTTPKSRPARATDNEGKPLDRINPLASSSQGGRALGDHDDHSHTSTTPQSRPVRAADHEGKPHDDHQDHSTTPKSRPARAADHEGKPHDDHQGHSTTPKSRPARAADDKDKPHDDHGHSTTPKSRPVRQAGTPGKPSDSQEHPAQAVPLAKLGNTEHSTTPRSRPARAAPSGQGQAGASPAHGGHERDGSNVKEEEKSKEHRHARDTEGPQDAPKEFHVLVGGEPVPINLDQKEEDRIKQSQSDRRSRDTQPKKDESAARVRSARTSPPLGAQVQPARQPSTAHQARQRRDDARAGASQTGAPNSQGQNRAPVLLTAQAKPQNAPARHTRDTAEKKDGGSATGTSRQFASSHGPTQGDLENIRRAQEQQQKQG